MSDAVMLKLGEPGMEVESFQCSQISSRPFEDVLKSLREAIGDAGMRLLHEIDPQQALAGVGQAIHGSRLLFFFHPNLVARVMRTDWTAMVEAPLKLVVTELPDGTVSLRMADSARAFGRYGNPALTEFGKELAATGREIIEASI